MATATPTPTPNPDAMKFNLDVSLGEMFNVTSAAEAEQPFAKAVFAAPGVATLFGVNDFVTVTRTADADLGADHRRGARGGRGLPLSRPEPAHHSISCNIPRPSSRRRSRRYAWNGGSWSNGFRGGSTTRSRRSYERL